MAQTSLLDRLAANPEIFGGKPIIWGMRIPVELILSLLAQGVPVEEILADYPDLEPEDVRACIAYAHAVIANDSLEGVQDEDEITRRLNEVYANESSEADPVLKEIAARASQGVMGVAPRITWQ
jgi:uncharacterized protein (DUF433 family)